MIVSHKHKFIFIKTNKTAGTSVEIFLSSLCGESDVITPISAEDEALRTQLGYRGAQNYHTINGDAYNHMSLSEVYKLFGHDLRDYFKFCVERHPAERVLSHFFWENRMSRYKNLDEYFLKQRYQILKSKGWDLYADKEGVVVDRVLRFENLVGDLCEVFGKRPGEVDLPHAKGRFRTDKRPYTEIMSEAQIRVVRDFFSDEIQKFGYVV